MSESPAHSNHEDDDRQNRGGGGDPLAQEISENRLMSYMDLKFEMLMEESDVLSNGHEVH